MTAAPASVLDASAVLAYLRNERGSDVVRTALRSRAAISAVNWAEALSKLADLGEDPELAARRLFDQGLAGTALLVWPFEEEHARRAAGLRNQTRALGLSMGDRACLALGSALRLPVWTADRRWQSLKLNIEVRAIR